MTKDTMQQVVYPCGCRATGVKIPQYCPNHGAAPTAPQPPAGEAQLDPVLFAASAYFDKGRCSGHAQFNGRYCRDAAGPAQWCIHCAGFMLMERLRAASVSGEAEPTYRALKAEAGHWMAETERLRLELETVTTERDYQERRAYALRTERQLLMDAAEMLWIVLANVSEGDWTKQSADWQEVVARWRDNYFAVISKIMPPPEARSTQPASGTSETIQLARRPKQ